MTTPIEQIEATIKNDLTFLQKHERLIIVALVLAAGSWGLQHYLNNAAAKSEVRAQIAEQTLNDQKAQNAANAATLAQVEQQYATIVQALEAQNAALNAAMASRQAIVVKNQTTDATLALPELANRLKTLGNAPDGSVSVLGNSVNLTQPGAVAVTQTLETIPALKGDLKDTQTLLQSETEAKAQADKVINSQSTQITGLNLQIVDADKACKAEITAVKAEARKSKLSWFKRGLIVGFLGGLYAGHVGL